jgi:hypothetical protein
MSLVYDSPLSYDTDLAYDAAAPTPPPPGPVYGYFFPPEVADVPPFLPDTRGPALSLARHLKPHVRGVNVFQLSNGTFVQDTATEENADTNVPYPWDPSDPGGPYSYVTNFDGSIVETAQDPFIVAVFYGGHSTPVNEATYDALESAGYSGCLTLA